VDEDRARDHLRSGKRRYREPIKPLWPPKKQHLSIKREETSMRTGYWGVLLPALQKNYSLSSRGEGNIISNVHVKSLLDSITWPRDLHWG